MRIKAAILVSLLVMLSPAFGEDQLPTLKIGDTTYSNVTVLRVTATDIYFSSSSGIGNVKLTDLSPELQQRFAPDAAKADELDKKQSAGNAQYSEFAAATAFPASPVLATNSESTNQAVGGDLTSTNKSLAKSFLNQPGPALQVEKWISASPNTRDKFVLIDFWAPSNELCRLIIPSLNGFLKKYGDRLSVIGISEQPEEDVRQVTDPTIDYSSAVDTQKRMENFVEVKQLPYSLLMDAGGIVRWEGNPLDPTNALTDSSISALLDKYAAAKAQ